MSVQTLTALCSNPSFGNNIIVTKGMSNLIAGEIQSITVDENKVTMHVLIEGTQGNLTNVHPHFNRDPLDPDVTAFFEKVDSSFYYTRGELDGEDFKKDLLPLYQKRLTQKIGYGTNPQLIDVIQVNNRVNNRTIIKFTTDKTIITGVDSKGNPITTTRTVKHNNYWTMVDPKSIFPDVYVIPKSQFKTQLQFLKIVAALFNVDTSVLDVAVDVNNVKNEKFDVVFNSSSLVYSGSISINSPDVVGPIAIYDGITGSPKNSYTNVMTITTATNGTSGGNDVTTTLPPTYQLQLSHDKVWEDVPPEVIVKEGDTISLLLRGDNLTVDTKLSVAATVSNGAFTLSADTITATVDGKVSSIDILVHDITADGTLEVMLAGTNGKIVTSDVASTKFHAAQL